MTEAEARTTRERETAQPDRYVGRLVAWLAYIPGVAAFAVAYFYAVGAIAKIAELRGAGFSPGDSLPFTPIPQILAIGVSTISWRLVVLIAVFAGMMLIAVQAERQLERISRELADLEQREHEQEQAIREDPSAGDQQATSGQQAAHGQSTAKADGPATEERAIDRKDVDELTPDAVIAEADRLAADLRQRSESVETAIAKAKWEGIERQISEMEDQVQRAAAYLAASPRGLSGNVRHPVQARRRRRAERDVRHAREQVAVTRAEFESQKADVETRAEATRQEINRQFATLDEIRQTAKQRRSQQRKARRVRRGLVALTVLSLIMGVLVSPPIESVSYVIIGIYFLLVFRRVRQGPRHPLPGLVRPTTHVAVVVLAVTLGVALEQFVAPGRLPTVVASTTSGSVSGFLVAQTDTQTTVGLPDCRIEAIPSTEIKYVIARPRSRRYGESVGTSLLEWIDGTKAKPMKRHHAKCGG